MTTPTFRDEVKNLVRLVAGEYADEVRADFDMEGEPDDEGGMTECATLHLELRGGVEYEVPMGIRKGRFVIIGNDDLDVFISMTIAGVYAYVMVEANSRLLTAQESARKAAYCM